MKSWQQPWVLLLALGAAFDLAAGLVGLGEEELFFLLATVLLLPPLVLLITTGSSSSSSDSSSSSPQILHLHCHHHCRNHLHRNHQYLNQQASTTSGRSSLTRDTWLMISSTSFARSSETLAIASLLVKANLLMLDVLQLQ